MNKIAYALIGVSCGEILDDESVYLLQTKIVASHEDSIVEFEGNNGTLRVAGACNTFQCPNGYDMTCSRDVSQKNVARGKRVWGSSDSKWGRYSGAVDGSLDRNSAHRWHSSNGSHSWLQIDLGAEYIISGMKTTVCNHYDYAGKTLANRAAGNDNQMKVVNSQYGCCGISCQNNFEGWSFPTRYIKMDMVGFCGKGPDHCIEEWEVYGTPSCDDAKCCATATTTTTPVPCNTFQCPNGYDMTCSRDVSQKNVARGKRVWGSSDSKWGRYSGAVDGSLDRNSAHRWHSSNGSHSWLQIDLGAEYIISGMKTTVCDHYDYAGKTLANRAAGNDNQMKVVNSQYGCCGVSCQNNFEGWSFPTRYIKMDMVGFCGKGPDHCIEEWEVYGTPTCDDAKCCTQSTTNTTATTTVPGGDTNPGGADCFGAIASWGPDFDCNEKSDIFCGNDSPDGMDVGLCCQDHCGTRQETRSKQVEAEGDRKQGEGTRKSSRQESSSKRRDAESARKKQRKEDEWLSKRGAQEGKNKNTEDERKNKKGFTEGTKKNERSWKSNRGAAKQAAASRERTRKRERTNKKNGNAESERLSKQSTTKGKERNKKAARATKKAKERRTKAARR